MSKTLIQENGSVLVILDDGKQDTVPNTPYNRLKIGVFEGNQISHKFGEFITVTETYDNGIFNCVTADGTIDLQSRRQQGIAEAIIQHQKDGKLDIIRNILLEELKPAYESMAIDEFVKPFLTNGRVVKSDKDFIIDGRFLINNVGKVFQLIPASKTKEEHWKGICVVVKNTLIPFEIDTPIGAFILEERAIEILSKIIFLMKPIMSDDVFVDQLRPDLKEQLLRDFPPPPEKCVRTTNVIDNVLLEFIQCEGVLSIEHPITGYKICTHCSYPSKDEEKQHYEKLKENTEPEEGTLEVFQYNEKQFTTKTQSSKEDVITTNTD